MSSKPKTTRKNQRQDPHLDVSKELEDSVPGRRRSTRLSGKVVPTDDKKVSIDSKVRKNSTRKVFKEETPSSDEEDKPEINVTSDVKRKLLMSPGTALAEQVGTLEISSQSGAKTPDTRKMKPTNLKNKYMQQRTPEKKSRSLSISEKTPEKRAKKNESSDSSDSDCESNEQLCTSSIQGALKARENEFESLKSWILESKSGKTSLSIYVSGQPGTGKTATTTRVLAHLGESIKSCIVNCASTNTKSALFKTIFQSLDLSGKPNVEVFEEQVKKFKVPLVLVLDEIDNLANRRNEALYAAFQWPVTLSYKVIILGIANSIDLTERLLPKLELGKHPLKRLVFEPYTKDDIVEILNDKLKQEEAVVDAKAIELTARKVSAMSGDLRTALHIFKQQKSRMMPMNPDSSEPPKTPVNGCREVLSIMNNVYSSPLARAHLPLQPRILLAVSLALSTSKKSKFDRNSLIRAYYKACEACRWPSLEDDDLYSAFQTLESQSFIRQINGGKLVLQVDVPTAKSAISDNAMLDQIGLLQL
ncbi:hypothetical protein L5515_001439 [Caenorhabditis briggsae]|uniref:Cell division control protein n=1 Tax=Caenorhabditis briggsae TaxID=6238 RepID=A0AAE9J434_CAEBR|nr:hypothetical protein L5515_001439 [Caenorhabditis briggsae]